MVHISAALARWFTAALLLAVAAVASPLPAQETGSIQGTVVNGSNGEPVAGATVKVDGTRKGAYTDMKGQFTIKNMPAGVYIVAIRALGYSPVTIEKVDVQPGKIAKLNVTMESDAVMKEEVVVEATAMADSDVGLLRDRQKSIAVSDAISAESISRVGGSSVADVANRVTGVSVMDGKYIYVRGLGDRYMNFQLNGAQMASSDPDRNDVSMDQFASSFVESIVTAKSFTPDQPGSFTGGSVNVKTKAFPSQRTAKADMRFGYNTIATLTNDYTMASVGGSDWLGMDDGTRAVPSFVQDLESIPSIGEARTDPAKATVLDQASKSFQTPMAPTVGNSGMPTRLNMSYGDVFDLGETPVGLVTSLQYAQDFDGYTNGRFAQWQLTGKASEKESLEAQTDLSDRSGTTSAFWSAMMNVSVKPGLNHQVGVNVMHNQRGENQGRYLEGGLPRDLPDDFTFQTRTQRYIERSNTSLQVMGEHLFQDLGNTRLEWTGSYNRSTQDEPDLRFFSNEYVPDGDSNLYFINGANYALPQHFYRDMVEDLYWFDAHMKVPFQSWTGTGGNVKFGGAYNTKQRAFREQRYEFRQQSGTYSGDPDAFFSSENVGIVDTASNGRPIYGNYIVDVTQAVNNYDGDQTIAAGFAMIELPVTSALRVITGVRLETTDLRVVSQDTASQIGEVNELNWLPSLAMIYALTDRQNLRFSYGRTLARPTFRELAPFSSFDFVGGFILNGNPNLKQTNVDNFDLRWEWFLRPTDIVAVSGFYKSFENPIENAIVSNNNQLQFQNVPQATVYGLEFEARTALDFISSALSNLYVGGNLTLTHSQVDIPEKEQLALEELYGDAAPTTRQLQGQSPYLLNLQMGFVDFEWGTDATLSFNVFGDRLSRVALGGTPNVFEASRARLDLVVSQRLFGNLSMRVQALNLLNPPVREFHTFKGVEYDMVRFVQGQTFTVGFSYTF